MVESTSGTAPLAAHMLTKPYVKLSVHTALPV